MFLRGDEFKIKVILNSNEEQAAIQCKLEYNQEKIQIVSDESYEELAKIEVGKNLENVTMDVNGNFVINTIKGKDADNIFYVVLKVKENVKLKNEKISLKIIDSTNELQQNNNNYILVGKQSKINGYYFVILGCIIIVYAIVLLKKKERRR